MKQGDIYFYIRMVLLAVFLQLLIVPVVTAAERLKVALALGGGGARGISHIGVLRALEEHNIPIDCVVGTSMGSIIGGLYASGKTPDEIEQIVSKMDWAFALSDDTTRNNKPIRIKERQLKIAHSGRLGVSSDDLGLPLAVLSGQNLNQVLTQINLENLAVRDFDNFPLPFRAVTTDLATGEEYVIGSGSISEAMRASMSVPGLLDPVELDGRLLVDGGMANNVPVSVARELCGDIVIAVSVGAELESKEKMTSLLKITEQISSFLTTRNTAKAIASLSADDLLIQPALGTISSASFSQGTDGIPLGYQATNSALAGWANTQKLAALGNQHSTLETVADPPIVTFVQLDNNTRLNDQGILAKMHIKLGAPLDLKLLNTDIDKLYGLDLFDSVNWNYVVNKAGETGINITAYQNPAKRNYLQFGLQLEHDSTSDSNFTLGMAYQMSNINDRGGDFRISAALGENSNLAFDFYQPIDIQGRYFINPIAKYQKRELNIFVNDHKLGAVELVSAGIYLGTGMSFGTTGEFRLGYERALGDINLLSGVFPNRPKKYDIGELTLRGVYDTLDSYFFPRSGHRFIFGARWADTDIGSSADYEQIAFSVTGAQSWGKGALAWRVHGGYSFDDAAPLERAFELGGLGQLSGLATNQLVGQHLGFASLTWYRYLFGIKQLSVFGGVSIEAGNVWLRKKDIGFDNLLTSGSAFVGADSPIGPVYLGVGLSEGGNTAIYLYVGSPFDFSDGLLSPR